MMHYQFAKLYLGHHVFRGLKADPIPPHFMPVAEGAREAAVNIFALIQENEAFRSNIIGMPHYFIIMISFAGHFLLEVCMKYREQLDVVVEDDFRRVSSAVALFARTPTMPQHPITRVTTGLIRKLNEYTISLGMESVLTGSPFANLDWSAAMDTNGIEMNNATLPTSFDIQLANELPDDFFYAGFSDLVLPHSQYQFFPQ
jgi:hypothetical protein